MQPTKDRNPYLRPAFRLGALLLAALLTLAMSAHLLSARPRATPALSTNATALAEAARAAWLPGEDVTLALQHDHGAAFFFVADAPSQGIDPVAAFLRRAEGNIRALFHHLLHMPDCAMREAREPWGAGCVHAPPDGRERVVVDVGANRGWYSLVAAAYGHRVFSFDPQPHCEVLLRAAVLMNGFEGRVVHRRAFVSDEEGIVVDVRKRTGCMGGFPNNNHEGYADRFRRPLDRLVGANESVGVGSVRLDDLFDPKVHDVLMMKVDVEGFESHVIASGARLIGGGAVRNIVMEFNIPMMGRQPEGLNAMKGRSLALVSKLLTEYKYRSKASHKGAWVAQKEMTLQEWQGLFTLEKDAFVTIDAWFYK